MGASYRDRVHAWTPDRAHFGTALFWGSALIGASLARHTAIWSTWALFGVALVAALGATLRATARRPLSNQRALLMLEMGDVEGAAEQAIYILKRRVPGEGQATAWLILARCAEVGGDFEQAVELFDAATGSVDPAGRLGREIAWRRAFALSALGRTREASGMLGLRAGQGAFRTAARVDEAEPLAARAAILTTFRSGDRELLLSLLSSEAPRVMRELCAADRVLLREVAREAGIAISDPLGVAARAIAFADKAPGLWLARALGRPRVC